MKIFIVITTYNEEGNICDTLKDLFLFNYKNIIIVDDGSSDKTVELVKQFNVNLLIHRVNRGQGASLQTGHDFALKKGADIVVNFDGDGQMQAKDIGKIIQPILDNKAQVVFGSRFIESKSNIPWLKRNLIHIPARVLNNFLTGIRLSDVHCGFRAFDREALKKIRITQDRMAHASEIVYLTKGHKLKYAEAPVEIIYKNFGQGFLGGLKVLKELFIDKLMK